MALKKIYESLKTIFKKEKVYYCLVWDGKIMNYMNLTQKQIDTMYKNSNNKDLLITKKDEIQETK